MAKTESHTEVEMKLKQPSRDRHWCTHARRKRKGRHGNSINATVHV